MTHALSKTLLITIVSASSLMAMSAAPARVAGSTTTVGVTIAESTQMAWGWSAKKSILGKTVYNESGDKVGVVEDLIVAPDKGVSYLIIGAGGFIGIGRHDVAIPIAQVQDKAGKLVMAGATKDMIKAMPVFDYASDTVQRERFIAAADAAIVKGKAKLIELEKLSAQAGTETKVKVAAQVNALKIDLKSAEDKMAELKTVTVKEWRLMEASASASLNRVRQALLE